MNTQTHPLNNSRVIIQQGPYQSSNVVLSPSHVISSNQPVMINNLGSQQHLGAQTGSNLISQNNQQKISSNSRVIVQS
jgi:hypothetical protein